jgi:lipoprotein-releasing system permease protein
MQDPCDRSPPLAYCAVLLIIGLKRKRLKSPYEWQIAWRYTRSGKRSTENGFISFIAFVSMLGIALGVAALIVVLSVMNGFQKEVRNRMLSVLAHIEIFSPVRAQGALPDWQEIIRSVKRNPQVLAGAPYIEAQGLLTHHGAISGIALRGVDPQLEPQVSDLYKQMRAGRLSNLEAGRFGIVLGADLASSLGVGMGDSLTLIAPQSTMSPAGLVPRLKTFKVNGIFQSGHYTFDSALALIHLADAETFLRLSAPTGVRLRIEDMQRAPEVAQALAAQLSSELAVANWTQQNATWFSAVKIEKRMMFIILTLIIAVAVFNLVSSLVMTVTDKQADIAILRTLGAKPSSIMKIFILQGLTIGLIGTGLGVALGCLIAVSIPTVLPIIEHILGAQLLPASIYFISELPSELRLADVTRIASMAFVLCALATLYPSWRAARIQPAQALRYE